MQYGKVLQEMLNRLLKFYNLATAISFATSLHECLTNSRLLETMNKLTVFHFGNRTASRLHHFAGSESGFKANDSEPF